MNVHSCFNMYYCLHNNENYLEPNLSWYSKVSIIMFPFDHCFIFIHNYSSQAKQKCNDAMNKGN